MRCRASLTDLELEVRAQTRAVRERIASQGMEAAIVIVERSL